MNDNPRLTREEIESFTAWDAVEGGYQTLQAEALTLMDERDQARALLEQWFAAVFTAMTYPCLICNAPADMQCEDDCPMPPTYSYLMAAGVEVK